MSTITLQGNHLHFYAENGASRLHIYATDSNTTLYGRIVLWQYTSSSRSESSLQLCMNCLMMLRSGYARNYKETP